MEIQGPRTSEAQFHVDIWGADEKAVTSTYNRTAYLLADALGESIFEFEASDEEGQTEKTIYKVIKIKGKGTGVKDIDHCPSTNIKSKRRKDKTK